MIINQNQKKENILKKTPNRIIKIESEHSISIDEEDWSIMNENYKLTDYEEENANKGKRKKLKKHCNIQNGGE